MKECGSQNKIHLTTGLQGIIRFFGLNPIDVADFEYTIRDFANNIASPTSWGACIVNAMHLVGGSTFPVNPSFPIPAIISDAPCANGEYPGEGLEMFNGTTLSHEQARRLYDSPDNTARQYPNPTTSIHIHPNYLKLERAALGYETLANKVRQANDPVMETLDKMGLDNFMDFMSDVWIKMIELKREELGFGRNSRLNGIDLSCSTITVEMPQTPQERALLDIARNNPEIFRDLVRQTCARFKYNSQNGILTPHLKFPLNIRREKVDKVRCLQVNPELYVRRELPRPTPPYAVPINN